MYASTYAPTNGMPHDPPLWTVVGQGGDLTTGLRFKFYFPPFYMTYWKPTIRGVFQLSAHHTSICVIPKVNTDGPPTTIDTQLNSSIWPEVTTTIGDKAQCATSTWSYGSVSIIVITPYFLYAKGFQHLMIENQNLCFINSWCYMYFFWPYSCALLFAMPSYSYHKKKLPKTQVYSHYEYIVMCTK